MAPPDEKLLLLEENASLRREVDQAHVAMRTLASVAVTLARMLAVGDNEPLDRELVLPREQHDLMAGAEVGISENGDGNLVVRIRDNLTHPVWEGR